MNQEEIKLLNKMKKLVRESKCRFKIRKDRDYVQLALRKKGLGKKFFC